MLETMGISQASWTRNYHTGTTKPPGQPNSNKPNNQTQHLPEQHTNQHKPSGKPSTMEYQPYTTIRHNPKHTKAPNTSRYANPDHRTWQGSRQPLNTTATQHQPHPATRQLPITMGRLLPVTETTQHLLRLPPELQRLANVSKSAKK